MAAEERLSDNAKRRVSYLLGRDPRLVDVATWGHDIVSERPETEAWHSITIPPGATGVDLDRDCPLGDCVTAKVRECVGIMRLSIRERPEIVDAFKMLVSLAADMHQPLLNGYPPSDGKEASVVVLAGDARPLFDLWEGDLIKRMGSEDAVLERVRRHLAAADTEAWKKGTYESWTWETHQVATGNVYPLVDSAAAQTVLRGRALSEAYDIVVDQLAKAAVRLALLLDDAWPEWKPK